MSTITQIAPKSSSLALHDTFATSHIDNSRFVATGTKSLATVAQPVWTGVDITRTYAHVRRRAEAAEGRRYEDPRRLEATRRPVERAKTAAVPHAAFSDLKPARRNTRDDISVFPGGNPGHGTPSGRMGSSRQTIRLPPRTSDGSNEDGPGLGASSVSAPSQDFPGTGSANPRRISPAPVPFLGSSTMGGVAMGDSPEKRGIGASNPPRVMNRHNTAQADPLTTAAAAAAAGNSSPRNQLDYSRVWGTAAGSLTPSAQNNSRHRVQLLPSGSPPSPGGRLGGSHLGVSPTTASAVLPVPLSGSFSERSRGGFLESNKYGGTKRNSSTGEFLETPPDGPPLGGGADSSTTASAGVPDSSQSSSSRRRSTSVRRVTPSVPSPAQQPPLVRHSRRGGQHAAVSAASGHGPSSAGIGSSRRVQSVGTRQHRSRCVHHQAIPALDPIEASLMLGTRVRYSDNVVAMNRTVEQSQTRHPTWTSHHSSHPFPPADYAYLSFESPNAAEARAHHSRVSRMPLRGLRSSAPEQRVGSYTTGQIMNITSLLGDMHSVQGSNDGSGKKGVGPHVLKILPVSVFNGAKLADIADDLRQCMVCLEEFTDGENLRWLPCLHTFHCNCIDTWLKSATSCPICKCDVEKSQPSPRRSGTGVCADTAPSPAVINFPHSPRIVAEDQAPPSSPRCNLPFSLFPPNIISHRLPLVHAATPPK
eukprot:Gregarina_sp_Poly_1__3891@NODE_2164_length_2574_cov_317_880734_g1395_i0_p1_GENE_NODE_2164_length_2574_cov_317_880734_g1395_i0NODE_2164_length_2574_cov_317_880734_g1395_i0_p1_ORF_typecomplete_len703_score84_61zfRING_2/PF13639_6/1_8e15zfRING_11/PF17123_5/8_4e10zfRING_11/PF17123_5/2_1e02zfrbx1/PF12678_7/2_2e08zfC3HC4_2/PF13923_6/1_4e07zfC3HC4/PF00097_25/6e07zfC3HC4_3/PF13920_6/3_6e06zfRING_5/PF14634_6/7_9e06zfRING_UBOX/PF13445_6/0_00013zfRING_UBOX/PF13445_6/8_9e02ProkRING_4/PF14447_6/4_1e05zfANAPC1